MDREYIMITDDSCDLPPNYYVEHNIPLLYLRFTIDGVSYTSAEMPPEEFYKLLRQGKMPTTNQVGVEEVIAMMEPFLQAGKDVFYPAFSSGLSGTCGSALVATKMLAEKYPERRVVATDTLCASMGQGLMIHKLRQMRDAGKSMDELIAFTEQNRLKLAHYVVADDLMHLHRGGRVSKASAVLGGMLGIKPLIHVNDEGRLISIGKARGRKQALDTVVDLMAKAVGNARPDYFTICHSDCIEDAEYVAKLTSQRFGINDHMIYYIGPVIGSHTGPGTIALFLFGEHR